MISHNREQVHGQSSGLAFMELMIAVAIISILWIKMMGIYIGKIEESKRAVCKANARIIQGQIEIYHARMGVYPADKKSFDRFLKNLAYFTERPVCPFGKPWKYDLKTNRVIRHRH